LRLTGMAEAYRKQMEETEVAALSFASVNTQNRPPVNT
jgi:hypothetical protein